MVWLETKSESKNYSQKENSIVCSYGEKWLKYFVQNQGGWKEKYEWRWCCGGDKKKTQTMFFSHNVVGLQGLVVLWIYGGCERVYPGYLVTYWIAADELGI